MNENLSPSNSIDNTEREKFGSRLSFVLASMGGAIGLGNVWKFPYLVGRHGGAAFIVVYLFVILLVGIPILMTEFAIGRKTETSYAPALKKLFPSTKIYIIGIIGVIALTLTLSFYGGIAGWTIAYMIKSFLGEFVGQSADAIGMNFGMFISNPAQVIFYLALMLSITTLIVYRGLKGGIELVCNFMLPVLFILIIFLAVNSIMLPGARAGLEFYLLPDFSGLNAEAVMAAVGQAFFSLGVGCGNLVIYGSYLDKKKTVGSSTLMVALGDIAAAILFGFIIFPAAFAFNIEAGMGPPLVFITLPSIFAQMSFGQPIAILFFVTLFFACITSTITIMEAIVGYLIDEFKFNRKKACIVVFIVTLIIGSVLMMSFGPMSETLVFGKTLFDFVNDTVVSAILLPLGGLLMVLLVGWKLKPGALIDEMNTGEGLKVNNYYRITIKYIAPIAIGLMFLQMVGILRF